MAVVILLFLSTTQIQLTPGGIDRVRQSGKSNEISNHSLAFYIAWCLETHPSFADDEEGVAACALADDVLSLFVGGLRKFMFFNFLLRYPWINALITSSRTSAILMRVSSGRLTNVGTLRRTTIKFVIN